MLEPISVRANGRWHDILTGLGMDSKALKNKHSPCPICGGKDRFRFDNKEGRGTYFCSQCGAGDGMDLACKFLGVSFGEVVQKVEGLIPLTQEREIKAELDRDEIVSQNRELWRSGRGIQKGDPVEEYLKHRRLSGVGQKSLRYVAPGMMLAAVQAPDGKMSTLHRTYIDRRERKLMPGPVAPGSAIRLGEPTQILGVAEGIETAMSASKLGFIPVWAAVSAVMMEKFTPPEGVEHMVVYGDNDKSYTGQASAFILAKRLVSEGYRVEVKIPDRPGEDWNDVLIEFERVNLK